MFCLAPFTYCEVFEDGVAPCCPGWMKSEALVYGKDLKESWESETFQEIRRDLNNGDPKWCTTNCPQLARCLNRVGHGEIIPLLNHVRIAFDSTCNLWCKSCRDGIRRSDPEKVKKTLEGIRKYGKDIKVLSMCGAGDPIASPVLRDFLVNFNPDEFPNLEEVMLHTNAQLFTPSFWNSLTKIKPFIHNLLISVDAATKETYEKIRRGGKWEILQDNLAFIGSLDQIHHIEFDFVIQRDNYKELEKFYRGVESFAKKYNKQCSIAYQNLLHWSWNVSQESYNSIRIDNDSEAVAEVSRQVTSLLKKKSKNVNILEAVPRVYKTVQELKRTGKLI